MDLDHVPENIRKLREEFLQNIVESGVSIPDPEEMEDISIGSMVKLVDDSFYTPELLGIDTEDFLEFKSMVGTDDKAIVFDYDENAPEWVAIVFEDGLEAFNVHVLSLENVDISLEDV